MDNLFTMTEFCAYFKTSREKAKKVLRTDAIKIHRAGKRNIIIEVLDEDKVRSTIKKVRVGKRSGKRLGTMCASVEDDEKQFFKLVINRNKYENTCSFIREAMFDKAKELGFDYDIWKSKQEPKFEDKTTFTMVSPGLWRCNKCQKTIFCKSVSEKIPPNIESCPNCGKNVL